MLFLTLLAILIVTILIIGYFAITGSVNPNVGIASSTVANFNNGLVTVADMQLLRDSVARQKADYDAEQAKNARMKGE